MNQVNAQLIDKMIQQSQGNQHDIQHFLKVYAYAQTIAALEGLSPEEQRSAEIAAIVHDIACPLCREKYGDTSGRHQEQEGTALAEAFLADTELPETLRRRVVYLVGHHHSWKDVDGLDYQVLLEADYLVNAQEAGYSAENIRTAEGTLFRTDTGKRLLREGFPQPFLV